MPVCFEALSGPGGAAVSSEAVCERLQAGGRAMVGYADVGGRRVVRLAVANVAVRKEDLEGFVEDVVSAARAVAAEAGGVEGLGARPR